MLRERIYLFIYYTRWQPDIQLYKHDTAIQKLKNIKQHRNNGFRSQVHRHGKRIRNQFSNWVVWQSLPLTVFIKILMIINWYGNIFRVVYKIALYAVNNWILLKLYRRSERPWHCYKMVFKIPFRRFSSRHRSTRSVQISWNLADGKSVKSCVVYLTKRTKFRLAVQLSLLRGSRPKPAGASPRKFI